MAVSSLDGMDDSISTIGNVVSANLGWYDSLIKDLENVVTNFNNAANNLSEKNLSVRGTNTFPKKISEVQLTIANLIAYIGEEKLRLIESAIIIYNEDLRAHEARLAAEEAAQVADK